VPVSDPVSGQPGDSDGFVEKAISGGMGNAVCTGVEHGDFLDPEPVSKRHLFYSLLYSYVLVNAN
jgi:hypothetical protein